MITETAKWSTVALLFFLGYEDLRYRAVSWWLFVPLALLPFVLTTSLLPTDRLAMICTNLLFLALQLVVTAGYFKVKNIGFNQLITQYIGWGDILFFVVLTPYFSPINYLFFFNLSLLVSLLFYALYRWLSSDKNILIPLAGLQSLCLSAILITSFDRYQDDILMRWIP